MQNDNSEKGTREEQMALWLEEIKCNTATTAYFNQFQSESLDEFIKSYISLKPGLAHLRAQLCRKIRTKKYKVD